MVFLYQLHQTMNTENLVGLKKQFIVGRINIELLVWIAENLKQRISMEERLKGT